MTLALDASSKAEVDALSSPAKKAGTAQLKPAFVSTSEGSTAAGRRALFMTVVRASSIAFSGHA